MVLTLIASLFSKHAPGAGRSVRLVGLLAMAALIGVGVYAWMDHDMTAERVGREIDQGAVELTHNTGEAIEGAAQRTGNFIQTSANDVRGDTANALDEAQDNVAPEQKTTQDN